MARERQRQDLSPETHTQIQALFTALCSLGGGGIGDVPRAMWPLGRPMTVVSLSFQIIYGCVLPQPQPRSCRTRSGQGPFPLCPTSLPLSPPLATPRGQQRLTAHQDEGSGT